MSEPMTPKTGGDQPDPPIKPMPPGTAAFNQLASIALTAGAAIILSTSGSAESTVPIDGMAFLGGLDSFTLGMILLILGLIANITSFLQRWRAGLKPQRQ